MRKGLFILGGLFSLPLICIAGIVILFVTLVGISVPQLPVWAQGGVQNWMRGTPMPVGSETSDNGASPAVSSVGWDSYVDARDQSLPDGLPLADEPKLGCLYHDPAYSSHTGVDFPATLNTAVYTTMAGKVVLAGWNGPWGYLVVIENNGYQVWLAHLNSFTVYTGQILARGDYLGGVGDTGNSTGPHLHYGVQQHTDSGNLWLDPAQFFGDDLFIKVVCQ